MRTLCVLALGSLAATSALAADGARPTATETAPATSTAPSATAPATATANAASEKAAEFHCDGTDPFFFAEMADAGMAGYGETWDEHVCDEGADTFAPGADARWKKMRTPRVHRATQEEQTLALVAPMAAIGGLGAIFLGAFAIAAVGRLKKRIVLEVQCPSCDAPLPVSVDDAKEGNANMFCPMCGAACRVQVSGRGKHASARVLK